MDLRQNDDLAWMRSLFDDGYFVRERHCEKCGKKMLLRARGQKMEWRCRKDKSSDCSVASIKKGSYFAHSNLPIRKHMLFILMWINKYSTLQIQKELKISAKTCVDQKHLLRELCKRIEDEYGSIGGPGKEIDLKCIAHSSKLTGDERDQGPAWILGGKERGSNKCFAKIITEPTAEAMIPLIRRCVYPDTVIHTAIPCSSELILQDYSIETRIPSIAEAYESITGYGCEAFTDEATDFWQQLRKPITFINGTVETLLPSYLSEIVVREVEGENFSTLLLEEVRNFSTGT